MALEKEVLGYKNGYYRIYGYECNEDNRTAIIRLKVYPNRNARSNGNEDVREMRREVCVGMKWLVPAMEERAKAQAEKEKKYIKAAEAEAAEVNKARKASNPKLPPLTSKEVDDLKRRALNREIAAMKPKLAQAELDDIFSRLFTKFENNKAVFYRYLQLLPEFSGCKSV